MCHFTLRRRDFQFQAKVRWITAMKWDIGFNVFSRLAFSVAGLQLRIFRSQCFMAVYYVD